MRARIHADSCGCTRINAYADLRLRLECGYVRGCTRINAYADLRLRLECEYVRGFTRIIADVRG